MTMNDEKEEPLATGPEPSPTEEEGRIGYGRYARYSPFAIAVVILIALLVIAIHQHGSGDSATTIGRMAGKPAPDFVLTTFSGQVVQLSRLRGSVVVVNFWAQWCDPCREEMPAFQAIAEQVKATGRPVAIVGVDLKNDVPAQSLPFAESLGITYPLGQDTGGEDVLHGPIQRAFAFGDNYPTTIFIRPDGVIDAVRFGPMKAAEIQQRIDHAAAS